MDRTRLKEVFAAASDLPAASRPRFLDDACRGDEELRAELEALLSSFDTAGDFLEQPPACCANAVASLLPGRIARLEAHQQLGSYEILSSLGAGGMGQVYRARDVRLDRIVALKVLHSSTGTNDEVRRRFEQEAKTIARLNHPNICALYDVGRLRPTGETASHGEEVDFLVMEFLEGETLAAHLERGPLAPELLLKCGVEIADALDRAHRAGIIHRDLKPSNIILAESGAKLLDFGIAKLLAQEPEVTDPVATGADVTLTQQGRIIGTVAYMSPEQVRGEPIDARSDLFSFGAVLHEMATGHRPFSGPNAEAVCGVPPTPPGLSSVVRKALDADRETRYQRAVDIKADLRAIQRATDERDRSESPKASTLNVYRRWLPTLLMSLIVLTAAGYGAWQAWSSPPATTGQIMLAVLPLENLSGNTDEDYFSDGLTEELITQLSRLEPDRLSVIARTSTMQYKTTKKRVTEIARELRADYVLQGTVRQAGGQVRISAQLIRANNETHVWADSYQRDARDVLALQSEVATAVAREISLRLTAEKRAELATVGPVNPEAHRLYLRGRHLWSQRTQESLRRSMDYFQQAINLEPAFAASYAALADAHNVSGNWGIAPPADAYPKAKAAAVKALGINERLAEAHVALAYATHLHDWNSAAAEKEFVRGLQLNPNYAAGHQWYAVFLASEQRFDEATTHINRARELDPLSLIIGDVVGWIYSLARRHDRAIEEFLKAIELDPNFYPTHYDLGMTFVDTGNYARAIAELETARSLSPNTPRILSGLAYAHAMAGQLTEARRHLADLQRQAATRYVPSFDLAVVYAALGDNDRAFALLDQALRERHPWMVMLRVTSKVDKLRSDPRFADLLKRLDGATLPG